MNRRARIHPLLTAMIVLSMLFSPLTPLVQAQQDNPIWLPWIGNGVTAEATDLLFRTRVDVRTSAMWMGLEEMNPVFLDRGDDWALLLVDDEQVESLARRRYNPTGTDTLEALTNHNAGRSRAAADMMTALFAQATSLRQTLAVGAADSETTSALRSELRAALHALTTQQRSFLATSTSLDSDNDGVNDTLEGYWCTNAQAVDSDLDGVNDGEEINRLKAWMNNERSAPPSSGKPFQGWPHQKANCFDDDSDAVPDAAERLELGLNADRESTDLDKFDDGQELFGLTFCTGQGGFCSYGALPRNADWGIITAGMPSWVKAPGNHPLMAAFPVPEIDLVESSMKVESVTVITTEQGQMSQETKSYSTAKTEGVSTSIASTKAWEEWQEVSLTSPDMAVRGTDSVAGLNALLGSIVLSEVAGQATDCLMDELAGDLSRCSKIYDRRNELKDSVVGAVMETVYDPNQSAWKNALKLGTCAISLKGCAVNLGIAFVKDNNQRIRSKHNQDTDAPQIRGGTQNDMSYDPTTNTISVQPIFELSFPSPAYPPTHTDTSGRSWGGSETTTNEEYEEHTVTNSEAFTTGTNWSTATAVNSAHAADFWFTYKVRNAGTEYAYQLKNIAFNLYIGDDPNPACTYFLATGTCGTPGDTVLFENFMPDQEQTFTSSRIPLSLEQMKAIDLGEPIRIVVENFSYGLDEQFYQDAAGGGLLIAIEDGTADGNEVIDSYLIPTWGQETVLDVLARYFPHETDANGMMTAIWTPEYRNDTPSWCVEPRRPTDFPARALWCKHQLSTADWWNVYTDGLGDGGEGFQDTQAVPGAVALFRFNQDSDRDGFSDRTETKLGTDPDDAASFPRPELLAGLHSLRNGNAVTATLSLLNTGPYDAYGVEAVMVAPDDSVSITNNTVGGSGRVRALKEVVVGSRVRLESPLPAAWTQEGHAIPSAGGYYTGSENRAYTFTVAGCGTGGCTVGAGSWALNWNDGASNSGTLNFGDGYASPTFLAVGDLGLTLAFYSGAVADGEQFIVNALTPRDTFQYTINREPFTTPLVIVSYNDPQGNHRFVIPQQAMALSSPTAPLQQFAGEMLEDVGVELVTRQPFTPGPNSVDLLVNNPSPTTLTDAHLFLEFINILGTVVAEVPTQVTLPPGPTLTTVDFNSNNFDPAYNADEDYIVLAFLTDQEGNIVDTGGRPLSSFQEDPLPQLTGNLPLTWNFGTVAQGDLLKYRIPLANTGFGRLYTYINPVTGLYLSQPGGTTGAADLLDAVLTLRTGNLSIGGYDQTIYLATSDPDYASIPVRVMGTIAAPSGNVTGSSSRPLDVAVTVTGPKNAGEWVTFNYDLGLEPASLHPVKVYNAGYTTLQGVGAVATEFSAGTSSAEMFGTGIDGDITINSDTTFNSPRTPLATSLTSGTAIVTLGSASGFNVGDEVLIIQIQGTGAGNYEFRRISAMSGNTSTLNNPLDFTYTQSSNSKAQIVRVPNYRNVTVTSTGRWRAPSWNGSTGGILVFRASDTVAIQSGGLVDITGKGFRGGAKAGSPGQTGQQGESELGVGSYANSNGCGRENNRNGNGGGGGNGDLGDEGHGGGGAGGGHVSSGGNGGCALYHAGGQGGYAVGDSALTSIFFGGGGGAGGNDNNDTRSGSGSPGGGIAIIIGHTIQVQGSMRANGINGGDGNDGSGGGGGGAGGAIKLVAGTISVAPTSIHALGGNGGDGEGRSPGGSGSSGRVRIEFCDALSGSTNPPANSQKLNCYLVEQTEPSLARLNLPQDVTDSATYNVQFGRKLDFTEADVQTTTLRIPAGHLADATLDLLVSGIVTDSLTAKIDIGADGSWDWEKTDAADTAATWASPDLAAALNTYWADQGSPTTGSLNVPVRVSLSGAAQVLLTNLQVTTSTSALRNVRLDAGNYSQFLLDFTLDGSGSQDLSVALDVGDNGSIDWSNSAVGVSLPHRYLTGDLSTALNSYLTGKSGQVTVPVRVFAANGDGILLNNFSATMTSGSVDLTTSGLSTGGAARALNVREGDLLTVNATLNNTGSSNSGPVTAAFFAEAPGWGDWYIGSVFVADIPAGGNAPVSINWDTTGFSGDVPFKVVVNPYARVAESNLTNNEAGSTVTIDPLVTPTPIATATPTASSTNAPTATPSSTSTTPTATVSPTSISATATPTPSSTAMPTATPSSTSPAQTATATASPSSTTTAATSTPTSTLTPTPPSSTATATPTPVSTLISPNQGGSLNGNVGDVQVNAQFPAGASDGSFTVSLLPVDSPPAHGNLRLLGEVFSIIATDENDQPITQFNRSFTITIHYTGSDWANQSDIPWSLFYWNTMESRWVEIPTQQVAPGTFEATLDHLTNFAILEVTSKKIYLPAIQR